MISSQSLHCTSQNSCLGAFDVHFDELDRASALEHEVIEGDRRNLECTEIVAFEDGACDEGSLLVGKCKANLAGTVRDGFTPYRYILNLVQVQVFFQDPEICRKRFECDHHAFEPNKP